MFAPSPQRELKREWDKCIAAFSLGVVANGESLEEFSQLAFPLCSDQESKLTGWMIREFGFERGNAAVKWAKERALADTRRAIEARNRSAHPSNLFEVTSAGWRILRSGPGSCVGVFSEGAPLERPTVILQKSPARDRILFVEGMSAREVESAVPRHMQVNVIWSASSQAITPKRGIGNVDVATSEKGAMIQLMIDASLQPLDKFTVVEFEMPAVGQAHIFEIAGMSGAWDRVKACAA
jgi:hypothetical protein